MNYILDTNAIALLMKGNAAALKRLRAIEHSQVGIPQPAIAEILYGIARLPKSQRKQALSNSIDLILTELLICPWTQEVSRSFGTIKAKLEKQGTPLEDFDIAIAAHAHAIDATLVTANTKHMQRISGLRIEDWQN